MTNDDQSNISNNGNNKYKNRDKFYVLVENILMLPLRLLWNIFVLALIILAFVLWFGFIFGSVIAVVLILIFMPSLFLFPMGIAVLFTPVWNNRQTEPSGAWAIIFGIFILTIVFNMNSKKSENIEINATQPIANDAENFINSTIENESELYETDTEYYEKALSFQDKSSLEYKNTTIAIKYLNKAIAINPSNPAYLDERGLIYLQMGQNSKAINDFQNSLAILYSISTSYALAKAYLNINQSSNAEKIAKTLCLYDSLNGCFYSGNIFKIQAEKDLDGKMERYYYSMAKDAYLTSCNAGNEKSCEQQDYINEILQNIP